MMGERFFLFSMFAIPRLPQVGEANTPPLKDAPGGRAV
jgi:hypothetical protein